MVSNHEEIVIITIISAGRRPLLNIGLPQGPRESDRSCAIHPLRSRDLKHVVAPSCSTPTDIASICVIRSVNSIREVSNSIEEVLEGRICMKRICLARHVLKFKLNEKFPYFSKWEQEFQLTSMNELIAKCFEEQRTMIYYSYW